MPKKSKSIPVNSLPDVHEGIIVSRDSVKYTTEFDDLGESHRDNWHLLFLQEKGTTTIEVDFQTYVLKPSSILYIHPNQVHRPIAIKNASFSSLIIASKSLKPEYLKLLEEITPVQPLVLTKETLSLLSETISLCINISKRTNAKLYAASLKDGCNTFVSLVLSQYLAQANPSDKFSRFDIVTKAFKSMLEQNFSTMKSPTKYAQKLNISAPYLNECVKHTTGQSVSYHIQQRVIIEAQRLLYHSNKSIKEISSDLGYDDHSYFTRLFSKVTGLSPQGFRSKNLE